MHESTVQMAETKMVTAPPRDPLMAILEPALKIGIASGTAGFLLGGAAGIVKSTTPILFATASGVQTCALGTTFWATRTTIVQAWTPSNQQPTPGDLNKASAISGGLTGGLIALVTRGRSNAIPGAVMFSMFGLLGQTAYNRFSAPRDTANLDPKQGFWRRMADKSWSPVTVMSDEEYMNMLKEKMFRVDVEISILDDRIAALKKQQLEGEQQKLPPSSSKG